jgi:MFS family permease
MNTIDNEQVNRTLEDIASIKEVINRNTPIIQRVAIWQQFMSLRNFRLLWLLFGISATFFSMLFYFLMNYYGSYGDIPFNLKLIIYIAIGIDSVFISILKLRLISNLLKKQNLTLSWWLKEIFPKGYDHISCSVLFLFYFLIAYFIIQDIPYYIIPLLSIIYGLMMLLPIGLNIEYSILTGYYFLVTGICLLIFNTIPASIAVSISVGAGSLIGAALGYIKQESGKEE